ncbi:expressed unknown protein [Seminavis robusta]|uniref:Transcription activator GCR1-like domain-containing protein n=1 Tax=Seminavis robusta TaxID=568900 RepID=A0A9N8EAB1_9STRA|nr:expressed unknown protein [Seminavis robusta]|eukprot:Sro722_g192810.1 n/a (263) ;mRNA; f:7860-8648
MESTTPQQQPTKKKIKLDTGRNIVLTGQEGVDRWLQKLGVDSFVDAENNEIDDFLALDDGATYSLGPRQQQQQTSAAAASPQQAVAPRRQQPPMKGMDMMVSAIQQLQGQITQRQETMSAIMNEVQNFNQKVKDLTAEQGVSLPEDNSTQQDQEPGTARLNKTVRTLELAWEEWTQGLNGAKPAMDFNATERGLNKNKCTYSRRLPIWRLMSKLVYSGVSVPDTIRRIKTVYGDRTGLIELSRRIKADVKADTLDELLKVDD